jgi:hypothetical protein
MKSYLTNPAYIMPALILAGVLIYYLYGAIDKVGLETQTVDAIVTSKTYTPGSTNYVNRIAGGRSWVQSQQQPDYYAISLSIDGKPTVALVSKEKYERLKENDHVRATISHTRITGNLQVIDLN